MHPDYNTGDWGSREKVGYFESYFALRLVGWIEIIAEVINMVLVSAQKSKYPVE